MADSEPSPAAGNQRQSIVNKDDSPSTNMDATPTTNVHVEDTPYMDIEDMPSIDKLEHEEL